MRVALSKGLVFFQKALSKMFQLQWILAFIAILYLDSYFSIPAAPGNSPYANPLGWWGWFDQGQYLKSANALLQLDLAPDKHFYPPLYPAVGALFLRWSSGHPYFLLNLFCLLWFTYVFIRVADRYVARWVGTLLFLGTTIFSLRIFENYLIPWTSTLSVALLASGILGLTWLQDILDRKNVRIVNWQVFIVTLCLGLLVPTRPGDGALGGLIGLALLIGYFYARRVSADKMPGPGHSLFYAISGFAIGPAIYFGFNSGVFGSLLGNYLQVATANGFFLPDLAEKFFSLWLDGETLYGEPNTGLTERYPWLYLALPGLVWMLIRGDFLLRALAISIALLFVLYMPYGDLLPNGLWRFLNIHYFKWTFPFLALFSWLLGKQVLTGWRRGEGWIAPSLLLVTIPLLLLTLHLKIDTKRLKLNSLPQGGVNIEMPSGKVDFIELKGLSGGFTELYFGEHQVLLDGHELKQVRDFRLMPSGASARLLFIRPISGQTIEFIPDPRLVRHDAQMAAHAGHYHFALGLPKPFRDKVTLDLVSGYRLNDVIDFSRQGAGQFYSGTGWSIPEDWGRWSVGGQAKIDMSISNLASTQNTLTLELTYGALLHPRQPCQRVEILANGHELAKEKVCIYSNESLPKSYRYTLPAGLISADGMLEISIHTPDATSPKHLGVNEDTRSLGVSLKTLRISE